MAIQQAWADYSTPLWQRAGRSQDWITQNIGSEWASSEADITRRYYAGDFGDFGPPPPDIVIPPPDIWEPQLPPGTPGTEIGNPLPPPPGTSPPDGGIPPPNGGFPGPAPSPGGGTFDPSIPGTPSDMSGQQFYYPTPYGFDIPRAKTYPEWITEYPQETFPWARSMYPEALGPGPESGEHYIPSYPQYRLFPYKPPIYTGEQYQGMDVPGSFFEGVGTPDLQAYMAGQMGRYPTASAYQSPLGGQVQDVIGGMLRGDVGIPERGQLFQQAMGEVTEATKTAREETTREMERMGRTTSGFAPEAQTRISETALKARADISRDFAVKTAEMQQEAKIAGVSMGQAEAQFGAGEASRVQQSRENAWGSETADLFTEYQSKLQTATTDYDMRTAQNEMVEAGQERAWNTANAEFTKQFEAAKEAGMSEYEAQQFAWSAALNQWETLYQSIVLAANQEFAWVTQRRAWSEQRGQIVLGAEQATQFSMGDVLGLGKDIASLFL